MKATAQILKQTTLKIIAVRASTAGIEASKVVLMKMFQATIRNINSGILILQHMPTHFGTAFAQRLPQICNVEFKETKDKEWMLDEKTLIGPTISFPQAKLN